MSTRPILYCAWFCPFAQRAWIALNYKGVDYEYVEQDPYNKTKEWLAINPRGMVPTIVYKGRSVYDSAICLEFVEEQWPDEPRLLPGDPLERAHVRIWSDHINKKIVTPFYAIFLKKAAEEREHATKNFVKGIEDLIDAMSADGPFFMGGEFGMADIMLVPYIDRLDILKHYRNIELPQEGKFARLHKWWAAVKELESVKKTIQPRDKLVASYQRYADGTAKSLVAHAVLKGQSVMP